MIRATRAGAPLDSPSFTTQISVGTAGNALVMKSSQINRDDNDSVFSLAGGSNSNVGANVLLYGGAHSSLANVTKFRASATTTWTILANGDLLPGTTESQDMGSASLEIDNIFLQNAATVSDERYKENISPITGATDFIKSLEPVWFTYKDTVIPATDDAPEKTITHSRPHTGVLAQNVKQAMTDNNIDDWAGYAYYDDEDKHMIRPMETIGMLLACIKELEARITTLEA